MDPSKPQAPQRNRKVKMFPQMLCNRPSTKARRLKHSGLFSWMRPPDPPFSFFSPFIIIHTLSTGRGRSSSKGQAPGPYVCFFPFTYAAFPERNNLLLSFKKVDLFVPNLCFSALKLKKNTFLFFSPSNEMSRKFFSDQFLTLFRIEAIFRCSNFLERAFTKVWNVGMQNCNKNSAFKMI